MFGLLAVLATAGTLLIVTPAETDTTDTASNGELQDVLDSWGAALRHADHDALATIVDGSAPEFLASETRRADALAAVPLVDLGYELAPGQPISVPAPVSDRFGRVTIRPAVLRLKVEGIDDAPTYRPATVIFVHRDDGWRILGDDLAALGDHPEFRAVPATWRGPWDHGPIRVVTAATSGGRSIVVGHPDRADLMDTLAAELPAAVDEVSEVWGEDWARRALVIVTGSRAEFTHLVGSRHDGDHIAAVSVSDAVDTERRLATGQRIVFNPAAQSRLTPEAARAVLRHELVHIAARAYTVDGSPLWLLEGYADYIGYRATVSGSEGIDGTDVRRIAPTLVADVSETGIPPELPPDDAFTDERSRLAYETAWSIAAYTAEEFGADTLTELYRRLATGPDAVYRLDDVLVDVVGTGSSNWIDDWGRWLTDRL